MLLSATGRAIAPPASICDAPDMRYEAPVSQSRTYRHPKLGFSVAIPANYRMMAVPNGEIWLMNPGGYQWVKCIFEKQIGIGGILFNAALQIRPVNLQGQSLTAFIQSKFTDVEHVKSTTLAGQPAVSYRYHDRHDRVDVLNIAVLTPDRRHLITLTGTDDTNDNRQVFDQMVRSFQFD